MRIYTFLFLSIGLLSAWAAKAQVTVTPAFPTENDAITITYDATQGTTGLQGATSVYMHSGSIVDAPTGTAWQLVQGNWGKDDGIGKMTSLGNNKWQITITPRQYYSPTAEQHIYRLGMVFRNADGSKEGKNSQNGDIFVDLYPAGLQISFQTPADSVLILEPNATVAIKAVTSQSSTIALYRGTGTSPLAQVVNSTELTYPLNVGASGEDEIRVVATNATATKEDRFLYVVRKSGNMETPPAGLKNGINYTSATSVTLMLLAPKKSHVYVLGDFNDWKPSAAYQMKPTDDGRFWLPITGLKAGQEYAFQYLVDGTIRTGDPFCEKILDPNNDPYIGAAYPNLKAYPTGKTTGIVSVLQTAQQSYVWKNTSFQRPAKEDLVIYELLVRDFVGNHDYKTLADTLTYLKKLGINMIELMPIMEFSGNESWGYNPIYYCAPDKYYGPKNDLKAFIDQAHQMGIAVILDMVFNQADDEFPYVKLYQDGGGPTPDNPFFNRTAKHPFNVFNDFNHESAYTKAFIDTVNAFWLQEYKFDGFRFDLTKGFTQKESTDDAAFSARDDSRIAILKRMYDQLKKVDPSAYVILEHFAVNEEEKILSDYGMMLWANSNGDYRNAAKGNNSDFSGISYKARNYTAPHAVGFMESHDEERVLYDVLQNGKVETDYSTKSLPTALERMKLNAAFFLTIPGPKMIWQFGEIGYDVSINENGRTGNKPLKWNYLNEPDRLKLYKVYAALATLKTTQPAFRSTDFTLSVNGLVKQIQINDPSMQVAVIGNFGITPAIVNPVFPVAGKWYDYFTGTELTVTSPAAALLFQPGEFHLFTTQRLTQPEAGIVTPWTITLATSLQTPVNLTATAASGTEITLSWNDLASGETGYIIESSSTSGTGFTKVATLPANATSFTHTGLTATTTYYYRIKATNAAGSSPYSTEANATTLVTGLEEGGNLSLGLYPNPTQQKIRIRLENEYRGDVTILLINQTGQLMSRTSLPKSDMVFSTELETASLASGVYLVELIYGNYAAVRRFSKN
jgi:1,4-alpha-glucan branching enzyme